MILLLNPEETPVLTTKERPLDTSPNDKLAIKNIDMCRAHNIYSLIYNDEKEKSLTGLFYLQNSPKISEYELSC